MSAEPALRLVEVDEAQAKAFDYIAQARTLQVTDAESYTIAGELWKAGKEVLKAIDDGYDSIIASLHKAHKEAVAKKKSFYEPVENATKYLKSIMSTWDAEQERLRKAEEARLAEIARKQAEEQALLDAIAAEEEAKRNGATQEEAAEAAQSIIDEPVYTPPVVVPKATPKLSGGPVYRTVSKFRITNEALIPRTYLSVDMVKIGGVIRALKGQHGIPGVEYYEERV